MMTKEIFLEAVEKHGSEIFYMRNKIMEVINNDGIVIKYIPIEFLTEEMLLAAVNNNKSVIQFVPVELLTNKITLAGNINK
jgi:hypothetical protein